MLFLLKQKTVVVVVFAETKNRKKLNKLLSILFQSVRNDSQLVVVVAVVVVAVVVFAETKNRKKLNKLFSILFQSVRNDSYDHHAAIYFLLQDRLASSSSSRYDRYI